MPICRKSPVKAFSYQIQLVDCWAKTDPLTGKPALTVRDHCMIVGHVAQTLCRMSPESFRRLLPPGAVALISAHDLGKITPGFQLKCPLWTHHAAISASIIHSNLETNHARVSAWHLAYSTNLPVGDASRRWLVSTAGHHGSYLYGFEKPPRQCFEGVDPTSIHPAFEKLRDELLSEIIATFGPLPTETAKNQQIRAHFLTGFTIFADWIGSNTDWFPLGAPFTSERIEEKTRAILRDCFGMSVPVIPQLSFGQLFNRENPDSFPPRPLQEAILAAADRPGLYIIEAPMGMGKTEAALAAAYHRWTTGSERGLYFALPTQLTSAKIHDRIHSFLSAIIDGPAFQSLIHGNAWLDEKRNRRVSPHTDDSDDTDEALQWFSSTRRQLLSPFGTGTIDQALLAILPARFAALRHFALAGKVVVIDEVHAYDPYMSALIDRLIEFLLPTGSTVIILSATLTAARRAQLVAAAGACESHAPETYPLITKVATGETTACHIKVSDSSPEKTVALHPATLTPENTDTFWQSIADHIVAGANVVVIRNTVALSQQTFLHLKSLINSTIPPEHCGLLHSRYTHRHRQSNEGRWIELLGKNPDDRPVGSLLVATQIVEQSVDIDADLLITDLAPTELILQRIGRLHRHPHPRPAGCETPACHILIPPVDWHHTAKEIETALAPHHFIYPPLALWQAHHTLGHGHPITLPAEIRPLLESSAASIPDPAVLRAFEQFLPDSLRQRLAQQGTAKTRHVFATAVDDREGAETRWRIQPTAHLILLRAAPEIRAGSLTIQPVHGDPVTCPASGFFSYPLARALHENAIRIPAYLVRPSDSPDWLRLHLADAVIAIVNHASAKLELPFAKSSNYSFEHTEEIGLTWQKSAFSSPRDIDPEDSWF
jgi:CRISPR-associated endonuclease/helicase Cas3